MKHTNQKARCSIAMALIAGSLVLSSQAQATGDTPSVSMLVGTHAAPVTLASYSSRSVALGVSDARIASLLVERTVFRDGQPSEVARKTLPVAKQTSTALMQRDAGALSFGKPASIADGYYAEHFEIHGIDASGQIVAVIQDYVFYQIEGATLRPLSIRQYSAATAQWTTVYDRKGATVSARVASAAPSDSLLSSATAAERVE